MPRRLRGIAAIVIVALASAMPRAPGSHAAPDHSTNSAIDDAGQRIELARSARRIVSLSPHLTELAYAAGGAGRIVGASRFSDHPDAARLLPHVGDAFAVNVEAIASLRPDLLLVWTSGMPVRQRDRLKALNVPIFESDVGNVPEIADTLERLGALMGTRDVAASAAESIRRRWHELERGHRDSSPVTVFYEVASTPLMTVNGAHVVSSTITACGGVNPFASLPMLVPTINREAVLAAAPQLVVRSSEDSSAESSSRWLPSSRGTASPRVATLPADLLSRMGPRFVDGAELLCNAIDETRRAKAATASQDATRKRPPTTSQRQP